MFKNLTPRQIALYTASLIGLSIFIIALLFRYIFANALDILIIMVLPFSSFIVAYYICSFIIERYIYRKIKLIYKNIHQIKSNNDDFSINIDSDIITAVNTEVQEWTTAQKKEIATLKQLEEYRRDYIGNVSHELKTPIFNIQGMLHTLLDGGIDDPNINQHYLNRAIKNVERLQTIVQDLETISRLEAEQHILDIQTFDIKTLIEEVFEDLEQKAQQRKISIFLKEGADQNTMVNADRETIRQVLMNLVQNSIKYGKVGGNTRVGIYDMDDNILVEVSDNGIGIANKHLRHLFDRFYRVDKSRSREQGGSGLGLSIVKHIIEAHKQTINVRSTEGIGSTFGFTLEKA